MVFTDRVQAGRALAGRLLYLRGHDPVVVGVAGGGLLVAAEIAAELDAPLDMVVAHKVHAPGHPGLALGAISEGGVTVSNHDVLRRLQVDAGRLATALRRERPELSRRTAWYRRTRPAIELSGATVVLVDDGIASGLTIGAAIRVVRAKGARTVVLAVPVAPVAVLDELSGMVDQVVCPQAVRWLRSPGAWYVESLELHDTELIALLREHRDRIEGRQSPTRHSATG